MGNIEREEGGKRERGEEREKKGKKERMVTVGIAHARTFETNAPMPRVNAQQASQNVGRRVLLVGRVLDGGVTVQTPDDGVVAVTLGKNSTGESGPMMIGKVVEICGVMDSQNSITEESRAYFGDSFDMKSYNEVCALSGVKYSHLFM